MRASFLRLGLRPLSLASVAALILPACGSSDDGAAAQRVANVADPAPAHQPAAAAQPAADKEAKAQKPKDAAPKTPIAAEKPAAPKIPVEDEPSVNGPLDATFPAPEAPKARPEIAGLPPDDPQLGHPLVIDGRVIPFDDVRRQACLGQSGSAEIELAKIRIYLDQEIERRKQAGAAEDAMNVSKEEMDAVLAELEAQVKEEYPEGEVGMDDVLGGMGGDPQERLKLTRLFNKLFLPDNPDDYPPITTEAIMAQSGGKEIIDHYRESYALRQKEGKQKRGVAEMSFDGAMVQQIVAYLHEHATIEPNPAAGVLYRVNGKDITVDDVWKRIQPVSEFEVRRAKQWITNSILLTEAFQKAGTWLSDEEAAAAYEAHSAPYKDSLFSRESVAVLIKRFPSVDAYKQYRRFYESFKRMRSPEMTKEVLDEHAKFRTAKILGQVTVDADVILASAFDFKTNSWKANGWEEAEKRMKDALRLLVEEQRPWDEIVEKYSDFYDAPIPVSQRGQGQVQPQKGRFRGIQRNALLGQLGETEYGLFLDGTSITDFLFFEQQVGTLGDPMRGPNGWYLPRLIRRTKTPERLPVKPEDYNEIIADDYLMWNLNQYAQKLIQEHQVYGF